MVFGEAEKVVMAAASDILIFKFTLPFDAANSVLDSNFIKAVCFSARTKTA